MRDTGDLAHARYFIQAREVVGPSIFCCCVFGKALIDLA